jgi:dihydrofolate reductase
MDVENSRGHQISGESASATTACFTPSMRHGLVDELRIVVFPVLVGGGKSYFPALDRPVSLDLIETLTFRCKATYLRYSVKQNTI